jgi:hypothetical protein
MTVDKEHLEKIGVVYVTKRFKDRIEYSIKPPPKGSKYKSWPISVYDAVWNLIQDENKGELPIIYGGPVALRTKGEQE